MFWNDTNPQSREDRLNATKLNKIHVDYVDLSMIEQKNSIFDFSMIEQNNSILKS